MRVVLFDQEQDWKNLLPLTFTRPVSEIRIGILTIKEKWEKFLNTKVEYDVVKYLSVKYNQTKNSSPALFINASVCPDKDLLNAIFKLKSQEQLIGENDCVIAKCILSSQNNKKLHSLFYEKKFLRIKNVWDIFKNNDLAIKSDFDLMTKKRKSQKFGKSVIVIGNSKKIFIEKGAKLVSCTLNTSDGPIYIGIESEVMEGAHIRGPFSLCEHSTVKMGAKIYGATTIGPHCKVGGEISNSVIFGYSNKAHDGFLGNSVIGEWCNLGADTNCSNLKNNYANVKLFNYHQKKMTDTGLQFCGLIMGDHSKTGINTMFNTGTVVGIACNIFGSDFPLTHIPSFSWGGAEGFEKYKIEKFLETAQRVYERRGLVLSKVEKDILKAVLNNIR